MTPRTALHLVVGAVALAAPALHSFTDAMEWLRAGWLPRFPVLLFLGGLTGNFLLALLPVSDILQTVATLLRNVALMLMGYAVLFPARRDA